MAKIDDIERRLLNWARWRLSGGGGGALGYAKMALGFEGFQAQRYREAKIPTMDCEASETDTLVQRLDGPLKATVLEHYLAKDGVRGQLKRLCCSEVTYYQRIHRAHAVIHNWLADRDEAMRAERERVERLQRSAA